jgi:septin family protein
MKTAFIAGIISLGIGTLIYLIYLCFSEKNTYFSVHVEMMKACNPKAKGNFEDFVDQFNKQIWEEYNNDFPESFFVIKEKKYNEKSQIHASIFQFNGVGMEIENEKEWKKVQEFLKEQVKKRLSSETPVITMDRSFWKTEAKE